MTNKSNSEFYQYQLGLNKLTSWIRLRVNRRICSTLFQMNEPRTDRSVLDIGVTADRHAGSNFFEKEYPYPRAITAVGTEDASFLEKDFPGLHFLKVDGRSLPFADKSFDLVVSFATLEHAGSRKDQQRFVQEACRVGKNVCIVVPNRWHPIEFHIVMPFIHWLPAPYFRSIIKRLGMGFYAKEENLNLLSERDVLKMFPENSKVTVKYFRFLGWVSNLMFYADLP